MSNRSQVSPGKPAIRKTQNATPNGAVSQNTGARNGRSIFGSVNRSTKIPAHTMAKASSVPIETSSPSRPMGKTAAMSMATAPVMIWAIQGVRNRGCTELNTGGSKPSLDMA